MSNLEAEKKSTIMALIPPVFVLVFGIAFVLVSSSYDAKAQQVPMLVGWSLIVLCILDVIASTETRIGQVIRIFFTGTIVGEGSADSNYPPLAKVLIAMVWPVAFVTMVYFFGFIKVIPFYVFLFVVFQGKKPMKTGVIAALIATAFTWVVFELLMNYEVYQGAFFVE